MGEKESAKKKRAEFMFTQVAALFQSMKAISNS
jgi:hypothetical protein